MAQEEMRDRILSAINSLGEEYRVTLCCGTSTG